MEATMNSRVEQELQARVEAFALDVTQILQRAVADSVQQALGGSSSSRGNAVHGKKKAPPSRTAGGRPVAADALLKELNRAGDRRMEELAKSLRTTTSALSKPMKELIAANQVKFTGQARGTKYRAAKS